MEQLPTDARAAMDWPWERFAPLYAELEARPLSAENIAAFLEDWTRLSKLANEVQRRLRVATTRDTADQEAERRYFSFLEQIFPQVEQAEQNLTQKVLASGVEPPDFAVPLKKMRADAALFREENLALAVEEQQLAAQYHKIIGGQTVEWQGKSHTLPQLQVAYQERDRGLREQAWHGEMDRQLADRDAINEVWAKLLGVRRRQAANAGFGDYRAYRWQLLHRFDYTPEDCAQFRQAIEDVVVPAAERIYERRRLKLGLDALRPWDLQVDPDGLPPLRPFATLDELIGKSAAVFRQVDPQLGAYFQTMVDEDLLDLESRPNKAQGGYCTAFLTAQRPFIFMHAVGLPDNLRTLLHEAGHAFHVFEMAPLPYMQQYSIGSEIAEVASMSMELLSGPYLVESGLYDARDAARDRLKHLEKIVLFWPYMAVVDGFQHWVYENPDLAADPDACDAEWASLWRRFMRGVDWDGLELELKTGWHRKQHIHTYPFYYIEYGLAQLGALQVWANARSDQAGAVAAYRRALALGGTRALPELFEAAGARLAFDAATLQQIIDLIEEASAEFAAAAA
ncbi:MAG TPA: M3 family oligoendopeptidase [Herpetosiphonaceae bacterium]